MQPINYVAQYIKDTATPENPVRGKDIASHFFIAESDVRKQVNAARSEGAPICSGRFGYFFSTDRKDIERTIESMQNRIKAQSNAIDGLSSSLR